MLSCAWYHIPYFTRFEMVDRLSFVYTFHYLTNFSVTCLITKLTMFVNTKHGVPFKMSCPRTSAQEFLETFLPVVPKFHDYSVKCPTKGLHLIHKFFSESTIGRDFTITTNSFIWYLAPGIWKKKITRMCKRWTSPDVGFALSFRKLST